MTGAFAARHRESGYFTGDRTNLGGTGYQLVPSGDSPGIC